MKRKKYSIFISLFLIILPITLFACNTKENNSNVAVIYGEVNFYPPTHIVLGKDIRSMYEENELFLLTIPFSAGEYAELRDVSEVSGKVHFVVGDYSEVEKAVVTTKWLYYSSLLFADEINQPYSIEINDPAYPARVLEDKYCMEKLHMDIYSYIFDEPSSPYYGKSYREVYQENGNKHLPSEHNGGLYPLPREYMGEENFNICFSCAAGLRLAALQRYGIVDITNIQQGIGIMPVEGYKVFTETEEGIQIQNSRKKLTVNVVGYIETEADKLLSTGVSMDKNSEEYKIVMQQLQNPLIYSVCGNFLEEVNS